MGPGESLATSADPLVQRQGPCRAASDGKPGSTNTRCRSGRMGHRGVEGNGDPPVATTRLPSPTVTTRVHPEKQRPETPSRHSHDEGPSHAGALPARLGPHCGDDGRPELLWVP